MKYQYADFAAIYDRLMDNVDYDQWIRRINEIFQAYQLSPKRILEVACGTGNITIPLAQQGYEMTGIDISLDMLTVAQDKALAAGQKILFLQQDMTSLELPEAYDALLCLCDGVNYLVEDEDVEAFFQQAYGAIQKGGILIFDVSTPYKLECILGDNTFGENLGDLCYLWENHYDPLEETVEMDLTFFLQEGSYFRKFEEYHLQRAHRLDKLVEMLKDAGFSNIQVEADYSGKEITDSTERAVYICRK